MPDPASAGSAYLLDAHGMIFQMFYGVGAMSTPDGRPSNAVFGVTRALMTLYDRRADYLIAAMDREEPTFRTALDANYKAHRDPPPDDLLKQEPMIQQIMEAMGVPFLSVAGYEADDVMATVASAGAARGLDVFLCTSDKDCRQLVTNKVKMLSLRKDYELLDAAGIEADWGVRPNQVIDFQSLVGDSVDNVPGVKGVGPKTAAKWLQQFQTLDQVVANIDALAGGPKLKQALRDAIANGDLERSRKLVALDPNVPIAFDWEKWKRKDWNGERLLELCHEFGFRGFAERVRKTLSASGSKKNAEVLAVAGLAPEPPKPAPAEPVAPKKASRAKKKKDTGPTLFDTIMDEVADAPAPAAPVPASAPARPTDGWDYSKYELVATGDEFKKFLAKLAKQKAFVFHLETTGLDPISDPIVGFAFCWEPGTA